MCPLHRWTYDLDGKLLGAPDFDVAPDCALPKTPLKRWNGLLFAGPRDAAADLADFPLAADYDYGKLVFDRVTVDECPFNWKTFLEIFLELYHVEAMHPGLRKWVDAGNYEWGFGDRWSYQILGIKDGLQSQVSSNYQRYRDAILAYTRRRAAEVRHRLVDPLSERDARVVSAGARRQHVDPALAGAHDQHRRVLLPGGSAGLRTAHRRGAPGGVRGVRGGGRRRSARACTVGGGRCGSRARTTKGRITPRTRTA